MPGGRRSHALSNWHPDCVSEPFCSGAVGLAAGSSAAASCPSFRTISSVPGWCVAVLLPGVLQVAFGHPIAQASGGVQQLLAAAALAQGLLKLVAGFCISHQALEIRPTHLAAISWVPQWQIFPQACCSMAHAPARLSMRPCATAQPRNSAQGVHIASGVVQIKITGNRTWDVSCRSTRAVEPACSPLARTAGRPIDYL